MSKNDEFDKEHSISNDKPNFNALSICSLRRYQSYHKMDDKQIFKHNKDELVKYIKNHFDQLNVDNDTVIEDFIKIEKDANFEKNNNLRKSTRFQEKNMSKLLDIINNK